MSETSRTRIRRCLFVGLGGTGMRSLLNAKKLLVETYGEVPPMIGFLGVDTDNDAYSKSLESRYGRVQLDPADQVSISMHRGAAFGLYKAYTERFSWIPTENVNALEGLTDRGAGQIRTNGRFAFIANYAKVENKVRQALNQIRRAEFADSDRYELMGGGMTEIHVAFSVCGGTGCGTFMDMAYLLRRMAPEAKIIGYAVLPDVFDAMISNKAEKAYIYPNAYGALQDLDYTMHLSKFGGQKFNLDYVNVQYDAEGSPFDSCYIVDNKNVNGDAYLQADQLSEMISLAMVTSAGELSGALASVSDNLERVIHDGYMNILNKKAWVAGLGVCEILFRGKELRASYAVKVMRRLITRLLNNTSSDASTLVDNWIDSPQVKIRENGGSAHDDVIDFILPRNPKVTMQGINNKQNARPEVDSYLQSSVAVSKASEIDAKVNELSTRVSAELKAFVCRQLNGESGVGLAQDVIAGITRQVDIFLGEMQQELQTLQDEAPRLDAAIATAIAMLQEVSKGMMALFRKSEIEARENDLVAKTNKRAVCQRDILRHQGAISFFNGLKGQLIEQGKKVDNIRKLLEKVAGECDATIARNSNAGLSLQTFQIDLSEELLRTVSYDDSQIIISDFLNTLGERTIADFDSLTSQQVQELLYAYAYNLPSAKDKEDTTIDAVIDQMSTSDFKRLISKAINKSAPLLSEDTKGYQLIRQTQPADSFYIGVANMKTSRFVIGGRDESEGTKVKFDSLLNTGASVHYASIGSAERIIIFRQFGVIPCYAIRGIDTFTNVYDRTPVRFHFDANVLRRMTGEEFQLMPKVATDDSLELWIKGFLFGLIKWDADAKTYLYRNKKEGHVLHDHWMPLAMYRNDAFAEFQKHLTVVREEFNDYIKQLRTEQGAAHVDSIIDQGSQNYYDPATGAGVGMIMMDITELESRGNEPIFALVTREMEFLRK